MKVGVILAGCGVKDGSEIHEATLTLLALDRAGTEIYCYAPNLPQKDVINHNIGETMDETRNCLVEAARIARGPVKDIAMLDWSELDMVVFPGGFGSAKNLCDFAFKGPEVSVYPYVERVIKQGHELGKPMCFICIAPIMLGRVLGSKGVNMTLGNDATLAELVESWGAHHHNCSPESCVVDSKNKVVSTPAYMLGRSIKEIAVGIEKAINETVSLI